METARSRRPILRYASSASSKRLKYSATFGRRAGGAARGGTGWHETGALGAHLVSAWCCSSQCPASALRRSCSRVDLASSLLRCKCVPRVPPSTHNNRARCTSASCLSTSCCATSARASWTPCRPRRTRSVAAASALHPATSQGKGCVAAGRRHQLAIPSCMHQPLPFPTTTTPAHGEVAAVHKATLRQRPVPGLQRVLRHQAPQPRVGVVCDKRDRAVCARWSRQQRPRVPGRAGGRWPCGSCVAPAGCRACKLAAAWATTCVRRHAGTSGNHTCCDTWWRTQHAALR